LYSIGSYGRRGERFPWRPHDKPRPRLEHDPEKWVPVFRKDHAQTKAIERDDEVITLQVRNGKGGNPMARSLSIIGFLTLAIGLLWIGQGTGAIRWPPSSFMINQLQWAGYGAVLGAVGLILIWQGNR
jgi:hypothetical protein